MLYCEVLFEDDAELAGLKLSQTSVAELANSNLLNWHKWTN
ncbi:hypothetical protein COLO4_13704 [Corchorus olitorius]|uniref:Uncharacterized protein n=1 Tax=Corchorus olitorius TaxID=93759 RepID=A0A1R3JVE1_9ROSI|nr:hypothetical protein COLO4_13704 [Corchorus olitorius]